MADDLADVPDPLETVTLLKSDFGLLQDACNVLTADMGVLFDLLGIEVQEGVAPREVFHTQALPKIAILIGSYGKVKAAEIEITAHMKEMAGRFGNKTYVAEDGSKGLLVGKKDPNLAARMTLADSVADVRRMTKAERRELERRRHP